MRIRLVAIVLLLGIVVGSDVFGCVFGQCAAGQLGLPALDKLDGFGLMRSDLSGVRPITRMEAARLLDEALTGGKVKPGRYRRLADYLLQRLKDEFKDELGAYDPDGEEPSRTS